MQPRDSLSAYQRAWNQEDEAQTRAWLERCWTERSTYLGPITDLVTGIDGLARLIADFRVMFPGATITPLGDVCAHHDYVCYAWRLTAGCRIRMLGHDYGTSVAGTDVVRLDGSGRLRSVVAFFWTPSGHPWLGSADRADLRTDDPTDDQAGELKRSEWQLNADGPVLNRL